MRKLLQAAILTAASLTSTLPALGCGSGDEQVFKSIEAMPAAPLFRCGAQFNVALARAKAGDWQGALTAYQAHLRQLAEAGTQVAGSEATLTYLLQRARASS